MLEPRPRYLVACVIIVAFGLIICSMVLAASIRDFHGGGIIRVTGSAREQVRSDFAIWDGTVTAQAPTIAAAFAKVHGDSAKLDAYLLRNGLTAAEIHPNSVDTTPLYKKPAGLPGYMAADAALNTYQTVAAYKLTQVIEVRSSQVDAVDNVSRNATDLLRQNVQFTSEDPKYMYTKMGDLKLRLLADAAKNAHQRAEQIAAESGSRVGGLNYVHMGVIQVTPAYSDDEVSDNGTEDMTSMDKKVTTVLSAGYTIR